jgi:hypothetical protein
MKKIKKTTRIIGKLNGRRFKTSASKWSKAIEKNPEASISFKEDEETTKGILNEQNEMLSGIREKIEENEELSEEEMSLVKELYEKS